MDLIENLENAENHWYYKHKYFYIEKFLNSLPRKVEVLNDVGAGSAIFSKQLLNKDLVKSVVATDINYLDELTQSFDKFKYSNEPVVADAYLLTDVLEHLINPEELLKTLFDKAASEGYLIITVPAHQILWSGHDDYLKHYRRYSIFTLQELMTNFNAEELDIQYLFSSLFLPVFFYRKINRKIVSQLKNRNYLLDQTIDFLLRIERKINFKFPFGISILAIYKINK
ncbi:MAG: hypothetical protein RL193_824 [Actinomycetota bacterium]|jgi:2-polyprenyl-3-methyl-5-hydroxy-6-metoxy-1,4-benzoquinol methylase